ncbi:MAG: hypothetical protein WKG07_34165 [Hymenobacter sp.]
MELGGLTRGLYREAAWFQKRGCRCTISPNLRPTTGATIGFRPPPTWPGG